MVTSRDRHGGSRDEGGGAGRGPGTSFWEWVVAGISTAVVLGAIGFLLFQAFARPAIPPAIVVTADSVIALEHGYLVQFSARNEGSATAAAVTVEGELRGDTGAVQTSEATLDYVPGGALRRGGLFFTRDPREHALRLRARGYELP